MQAKLDDLVVQIGDDSFYSMTPSAVDGQYEVSITLRMDDKALRTRSATSGSRLIRMRPAINPSS